MPVSGLTEQARSPYYAFKSAGLKEKTEGESDQ
jgi:hypothetical protein